MSDALFLTDAELVDLTGLSQAAAQIKWLRKYGIKVYRRVDGKPRVPRAAFVPQSRPASAAPVQPNFEVLRGAR